MRQTSVGRGIPSITSVLLGPFNYNANNRYYFANIVPSIRQDSCGCFPSLNFFVACMEALEWATGEHAIMLQVTVPRAPWSTLRDDDITNWMAFYLLDFLLLLFFFSRRGEPATKLFGK